MRLKSLDELPKAMREHAAAQIAATRSTGAPVPSAASTRPNKFGAERVEMHGIEFASKWQAQRYQELLMMERADLIRDLAVEVPFALDVVSPSGDLVRIGAYIADAVYWRGEQQVVEDAKSVVTRKHPLYLWKKAHFETQYGIPITEVEKNKPRSGVST